MLIFISTQPILVIGDQTGRDHMKRILFIITLITQAAIANGSIEKGCIPENNLYYPVNGLIKSGIDFATYNQLIDKAVEVYRPIMKEDYGLELSILKLWTDGEVNAFANRRGSKALLKLPGGLARHPQMTKEIYATIVCHEVGHILGGAPKYEGIEASSEGQADYFATLKCLKRVFKRDFLKSSVLPFELPSTVQQQCSEAYSNEEDYQFCLKSAHISEQLAQLLAQLTQSETMPNLQTPSDFVTRTTIINNYPSAQCRLDTYLSGSLCNKDEKTLLDDADESLNVCNQDEINANGYRPLCWYAPDLSFLNARF